MTDYANSSTEKATDLQIYTLSTMSKSLQKSCNLIQHLQIQLKLQKIQLIWNLFCKYPLSALDAHT